MTMLMERVLRVRYHLTRRVRTGKGWRLFAGEDLRTGRPCLVYEVDLDSVASKRQVLLQQLRQMTDERFPFFTDMFVMGPRCYAVQNMIAGRTLADEMHANPNGIDEHAAAERGAWICDLLLANPNVDSLDPERLVFTPNGLHLSYHDLDETEAIPDLSRLRILAFVLQALCSDGPDLRSCISRAVSGHITLLELRAELRLLATRPAYACVA